MDALRDDLCMFLKIEKKKYSYNFFLDKVTCGKKSNLMVCLNRGGGMVSRV